MINNQSKTKNKLFFAFLLLTAIAAMTILNTQLVSAQEDHEFTTVMVLPATGGTTSLKAGNHSYLNNTALTMTATPNEGFEFLYWNITGIMNTADDHESMETDKSDMGHGGPFGELSDLDSLILTESSTTIKIDCAYTYEYQAFFTPNQNISPTEISGANVQPQTFDSNNTLTYLAVGVVAAIVVVVAIAVLFIKNRKSSNTSQDKAA